MPGPGHGTQSFKPSYQDQLYNNDRGPGPGSGPAGPDPGRIDDILKMLLKMPLSAAASLFSLEIVTPKVVPAEKRVEVPPTLTQAHATVFASDNPPQQQQTMQQQVVTSLVSLETVTPKFVCQPQKEWRSHQT